MKQLTLDLAATSFLAPNRARSRRITRAFVDMVAARSPIRRPLPGTAMGARRQRA